MACSSYALISEAPTTFICSSCRGPPVLLSWHAYAWASGLSFRDASKGWGSSCRIAHPLIMPPTELTSRRKIPYRGYHLQIPPRMLYVEGRPAGRPQTSERSAAMPGAARARHWPVRAVHARTGPPKSTASRAWGIKTGPPKSTRRLLAGAWGISLASAAGNAAESRPGSAALSSLLIANAGIRK
jgi:hypothetical protein